MYDGSSWDDLIVGETEWTISTQAKTHRVEFEIHWTALFEQLDAWAKIHDGRCYDFEVSTFFQDIAHCNDGSRCGIDIYFFKDGKKTKNPPHNEHLIAAVNAMQKSLENDLFNEIAAFNQSELGRVSRSTDSFFTLKANYEKRTLDRNERRILLYNPGGKDIVESTIMNIECLKADDVGRRVNWDMNSESCKMAIKSGA